MPIYEYVCSEDKGGCGTQYEVSLTFTEYDNYQPKCPSCRKKKSLSRIYDGDVYINLAAQTLGMLANVNTDRMSADERNHLTSEHTKYKDEAVSDNLPEGASRYTTDVSGKRVVSQHQHQTDPRKKLPPKPKRQLNAKKSNNLSSKRKA